MERKILINAGATYTRSLVALVLGLFSARWVLVALGEVDFGLYTVVGSLVALFSVISGLLSVSVARHYAFSLGIEIGGNGLKVGEKRDIVEWCRAAVMIHSILGGLLIILGCPIGEWVVREILVIPPERISSCVWVFRLSVLGAFSTIFAVPFAAMYTARQRFVKLAVFGLGQTLVMFVGAWCLRTAHGDRLLIYAGYMALAFVGLALAQIIGTMIEFPECRRAFTRPQKKTVLDILYFAGWTLFGGLGWMLAFHGGALVTNRFFGATANAAYGVAHQVQYQTESLSNALVGAFSPAVTTSEGSGDRRKMIELAYQSGRLGTLLILLFAVPLSLELPTVLKLWLKSPPEWAAQVCTVLLVSAVLNKLMMGQQLALNACGKIARWQVICGILLALAMPLSAVLAWIGIGVVAAAWAFLAAMVGCCAVSVIFADRLAGVKADVWTRNVLLPILGVSIVAVVAGCLPRIWLSEGFWRVAATTLATSIVFAVFGKKLIIGDLRSC